MTKVWRTLLLFALLFSSVALAHAAGAFEEGDQGQEVTQIQGKLNTLGYDVSVDGDFGPSTTAAVIAFQRDHGLDSDGIVGASTYRALMERDIPVSRDGSTATIRRVIQTSMRYVGVPYAFGGTSPYGFDCSGFVRYVFGRSGVALPRMADEQFDYGDPVSYSSLQPGDLVFFSTYTDGVSHVGIYLGDGRFISATSSRGVAVTRVDDGYWGPRYVGARRLL